MLIYYSVKKYCIEVYSTVQYSTVQYTTVQYSTVGICTILHSLFSGYIVDVLSQYMNSMFIAY